MKCETLNSFHQAHIISLYIDILRGTSSFSFSIFPNHYLITMASIRDDEDPGYGFREPEEQVLNHRKVVAQQKDGLEDDDGENKEVLSTEMLFKDKEVPAWKNQLTFRAFVVSFVLGILFSVIVMKLNLTSGIIPSLNVSAGLLGFFFIRIYATVLEKAGLLKQPFTRQENTVIQTCVVATSGIAFSGMSSFLRIIFVYLKQSDL